jgi:hypothetical protein
MTGSSLAPIVIPIVVTIALAVWLVMVFYAAARPGWKAHSAPSKPRLPDAGEHPETRRQAGPGRAVATAAHSTDAVESETSADRRQAPPAAPRRAA